MLQIFVLLVPSFFIAWPGNIMTISHRHVQEESISQILGFSTSPLMFANCMNSKTVLYITIKYEQTNHDQTRFSSLNDPKA